MQIEKIEQAALEFHAMRGHAASILKRTKARAISAARGAGETRYIIMTRNGPRIMSQAPEMGDYWAVTPQGVVAYFKGPRV